MLLSEVGVQVQEAPPFEFSLLIPDEFVGTLELSAAGENAAGDYATTEAATVTVESQATLTQIELSPGAVFLNGFDDRRQLTVLGTFDDGVIRDLSAPPTGTTYTSSDPTIASVSATGEMRPRRDGIVTIIANNSTLQDSISVEVLNVGDLLFRDSFEAPEPFAASAGG
mgnify:FL=1